MNSFTKRLFAATAAGCMLMTVLSGCGNNKEEETPVTTTTVATTTTTAVPTTTHPAVMDEELNVREGPGSDYGVIGGVLKGESIVVVGREGDWYKIRFGDTYGYVNAHYVHMDGQPNASQMQAQRPTVATTTTMKDNKGVVKTDKAAVRPAPDAEEEAIGELKKDDPIVITGRDGDWYEIEYNGGIGYVKVSSVTLGTKATTTGTTKEGETTAPSVAGSGKVTTTTAKNGIPETAQEDTL